MILIGITGPIGHGKTTLAHSLLRHRTPSQALETSDVISDVANAWRHRMAGRGAAGAGEWLEELARVLESRYGVMPPSQAAFERRAVDKTPGEFEKLSTYVAHLTPQMQGEVITSETKTRHRALLQWLGGYLVKHIRPGIWYDEIEKRIKRARSAGCRLFVVAGLRYPHDGEVIRRNHGIVIEVTRPSAPMEDASDPTERERQRIRVDSRILNNADIPRLQRVAARLFSDIEAGRMRPRYDATQTHSL